MERDERLEKTMANDNNAGLKTKVGRYLVDGKNKLMSLERLIRGDKKVQRLLGGANGMGKKIHNAKRHLEDYGKKTERYIEENPKKAMAIAAAAGVLAGSLWAAFRGKKPSPRRKK